MFPQRCKVIDRSIISLLEGFQLYRANNFEHETDLWDTDTPLCYGRFLTLFYLSDGERLLHGYFVIRPWGQVSARTFSMGRLGRPVLLAFPARLLFSETLP